jgi:hypothetical protein
LKLTKSCCADKIYHLHQVVLNLMQKMKFFHKNQRIDGFGNKGFLYWSSDILSEFSPS